MAFSYLCIFTIGSSLAAAPSFQADASRLEFFEKRVRPVLAEHCYACHGPSRQKSNLRLDHRELMLRGGNRGPAITPGDAENSALIQAVRYTGDEVRMPPKGKLSPDQIRDLTAWVNMGAPAPSGEAAVSQGEVFDLDQRRREHWAWQPIRSTEPPDVQDGAWPRDPLDRFVLARLEAANLRPARPADRRTLIRRVYFDIIGLPPEPAEIEAFVADDSPDAFEKLINRLLASPHFGERWGRHWLDLVRYAETRGHEFDHIIPNAYQYRDYVIRALNGDIPYDQFLIEHIAGDLVASPRLHPTKHYNESVLGTGFWFLGEEVHSPVDIRGDETDRIDNKIDVFSKAFLALTVSCARCHDHKFDAISTRDYYALAGYVLSSSYRQVAFGSLERHRELAIELESLGEQFRPAIGQAITAVRRPVVQRLADYLMAAREHIQAEISSPPGASDSDAELTRLAAKQQLDSDLLRRWVALTRNARSDADHPFHVWAAVSHHTGGPFGSVREIVEPLVNRQRERAKQGEAWRKDARVIVDFSAPGNDDWKQDGFAFRLVQPGEPQISTDPSRPVSEIYHFGAATTNPAWNGFRVAPGAERDPGKVSWPQSGRTLRTQTFTLQGGKLFYLVRGAGHAYAAVDSHRLIAGPLHGALVRSWKAQADGNLHWIEHDLSAYRGHRLHLEFSPQLEAEAAGGLAILAVVESEKAPRVPLPGGGLLSVRLSASDLDSPMALARSLQNIFEQVIDRQSADAILKSPGAETTAWLANWMIQQDALFSGDEPGGDRQIAQLAGPFVERYREIQSRVQGESHTAPAMIDGSAVTEYLLHRGNHRTPGEMVPRRLLEALEMSALEQPNAARDSACYRESVDEKSLGPSGSGRLDLAQRMIDPSNPFVRRVIVNRIWHHLFGRGIVASVDNFGALGEPPTHPELLDYLAVRFDAEGDSIKRLIRTIMLSSTYQMSAQIDPQARQADPRNLLLHHMAVRRLDAEVIRDAMLAISGRLDRTMYGPSVEIHLTSFMEGRGRPTVSGPLDGAGRRSIYLRARRNFPLPMLVAFDSPTPFTTMGRRSVSNVPAQALILMNNPFVLENAQRWAAIIQSKDEWSVEQRLSAMYGSAFGRPPTASESAGALKFLQVQQQRYACEPDDPRPWADLAHVLLNVKEFIFLQ